MKKVGVLSLGEYLAEELESRGWTPRDFAGEIEQLKAREIDGKLVRDIQVRELEIELVIACSNDKSCRSGVDSLKAFAEALGCDWRFLSGLQDAYLSQQ